MEKETVRILLLGKTGVGKSSFINYLLNHEIAKTGVGKPVTQNLEEYTTEIEGINLVVTDSKGLEVKDFKNIVEKILENVKEKNGSENISDWYHTIFYCISASNSRIEDEEISFIKKLKKESSITTNIILTNCDNVEKDREKLTDMKKILLERLEEEIAIYEVCSREGKKRNGDEYKKTGKEEIEKGLFDLVWKDICKKVAIDFTEKVVIPRRKRMTNNIRREGETLIKEKIKFLDLAKEAIRDKIEISDKIEELIKELKQVFVIEIEDLEEKLEIRLNKQIKEIRRFYSSYCKIICVDIPNFESVLKIFFKDDTEMKEVLNSTEMAKLMNKIENLSNDIFEIENILKKIDIGWNFINIQKNVLDTWNKLCDNYIKRVDEKAIEEDIYSKIYSAKK